jgi:hypothetical protein
MDMKPVKKLLVLLAIGAAITGMIGCASGPKPKLGANQQKQVYERLDWKGAIVGSAVPEWFVLAQEADTKVQALDEYKGYYCFVVTADSPPKGEAGNADKDWVIGWVNNTANGAEGVSTLVGLTTVNDATTNNQQQRNGENIAEIKAQRGDVKKAMSGVSFNRLRKVADFWMLGKNLATKKQIYTAASLWIIPTKEVNIQIAQNYQNLLDNNVAMSATLRSFYEELIRSTLAKVDTVMEVQPVSNEAIAEYNAIK